ncbi:MAG: hypothetical protein EAX96_04875 [Candidatus Lokiarchaeota archaeon]|nr:hypothetical protein [Candidatus Lokiarchaeota archaeon]
MADSGIPFITSIANDIYDRVDKLANTLQKIPAILSKITEGFQENLNRLNENIENMLEESRGNRDLTLEAFSDSMTTLSQKIREIKNENEEIFRSGEIKETIEKLDDVSKKLASKYWDINIILIIHSIHWIVDLLKGKIKNINLPPQLQTAVPMRISTKQPILISTPSPQKAKEEREVIDSKESQDARAFAKGRRPKTHDEQLEEIERRKKLFGRY